MFLIVSVITSLELDRSRVTWTPSCLGVAAATAADEEPLSEISKVMINARSKPLRSSKMSPPEIPFERESFELLGPGIAPSNSTSPFTRRSCVCSETEPLKAYPWWNDIPWPIW